MGGAECVGIVTNSKGTSYGSQITFSTLQNPVLATVATTDATAITQTTATSGGNVTSDGGSAVTSRGVCWSTSANPTTTNSHTTDGSGTGIFVSSLTGLSPNTVYYVRAYAVNSVGTTYGNQVSFTTLSIIPPTVTTTAVTNITQTTATSGGSVTADGGATVTARGVCWSTTSSPTIVNSHTTDGSGTGTFVSNLTGLTANTLYYVRAYATNNAGTTYGNEVTFTTLSAWQCGDTIQYSGQTYNTVLIGTQCWTEQNLNVGTMIPGTQNQTNNSIIEKYCYHDSVSNCTVYGGLYMWNEMMQYSTSSGAQGICPSGWHIPTDNDWCSLATFLDPSINCNTSALNTNNAGGQMKESGTNHWNPPNTGATNSSGFTALGGGRKNLGNYWFYLKQVGEFWTSNLMDSSDPYFYSMDYNFAGIARGWQTINNSTSVRCIKN